MKRVYITLFSLAVLLSGCAGNASLNVAGTYCGTTPAADCPGIYTVTVLDEDGTCSIEREYLERFTAYRETGTYTVSDSVVTIVTEADDTIRYKVENAALRQLDMDGNVIEGALSEMYVLSRCNGIPSVSGKWVQPVPGFDADAVQGVELSEDGTAKSINMATLQYSSWDRVGNLMYLTGKSIGNGQTIDFTDTLSISKCDPDSLVLMMKSGYKMRYSKMKE